MGNNKLKYKSPLRYPGGKGCIYEFMTHLLRENDMVGIRYAEPYAGGAGLALALLMDEYVSDIYINDLDPSIYSLWWAILNRPDDLMSWIENVDISTVFCDVKPALAIGILSRYKCGIRAKEAM